MMTSPQASQLLPILSVVAMIIGFSSLDALAQALWQEHITDDPTPISYQIGEEWLSIPANCIIDIPPFLEIQKRTEEKHSIQFFWPNLTCLTEERLEDFRNPATDDLIRILTSGLAGHSPDFTWAFLLFIGSVEGVSKYTFDEATFELNYDDVLDMYVRQTLFIDQKIDLLVDRDHDLRSITRFLRCGEGDWYCRWFGQFCGLDVQVAFNRVQLPNAKAIYDDTYGFPVTMSGQDCAQGWLFTASAAGLGKLPLVPADQGSGSYARQLWTLGAGGRGGKVANSRPKENIPWSGIIMP